MLLTNTKSFFIIRRKLRQLEITVIYKLIYTIIISINFPRKITATWNYCDQKNFENYPLLITHIKKKRGINLHTAPSVSLFPRTCFFLKSSIMWEEEIRQPQVTPRGAKTGLGSFWATFLSLRAVWYFSEMIRFDILN